MSKKTCAVTTRCTHAQAQNFAQHDQTKAESPKLTMPNNQNPIRLCESRCAAKNQQLSNQLCLTTIASRSHPFPSLTGIVKRLRADDSADPCVKVGHRQAVM